MTISDLTRKYDAVSDAIEQASQADKAQREAAAATEELLAADEKLAKDQATADKAKAAYRRIFENLGTIGMAMGQGRAQCQEYKNLLDGVMRATAIEWPPKCVLPGGREA